MIRDSFLRVLVGAVLALALLALPTCSALPSAVAATNVTRDALVDMHTTLKELHTDEAQRELDASQTEDEARRRVDEVHKRFHPGWVAYSKARTIWLALRAVVGAAVAADAAGKDIDVAAIKEALEASFGSWQELSKEMQELVTP